MLGAEIVLASMEREVRRQDRHMERTHKRQHHAGREERFNLRDRRDRLVDAIAGFAA